MRSPAALLGAVLIAVSASRAQPPATKPPLTPEVEFLLKSAAGDFHAHATHKPARFRNVRGGYLVDKDGTKQYRLCGEFQPADANGEPEWSFFATLKTSGYEQWLGGQSLSYCNAPSIVWEGGDLSSTLQSRLDALR